MELFFYDLPFTVHTHTVQGHMLSTNVKVQKEQNFTISQQSCNIVEIKRLHGVETCIGMIQVYKVWSFNV